MTYHLCTNIAEIAEFKLTRVSIWHNMLTDSTVVYFGGSSTNAFYIVEDLAPEVITYLTLRDELVIELDKPFDRIYENNKQLFVLSNISESISRKALRHRR